MAFYMGFLFKLKELITSIYHELQELRNTAEIFQSNCLIANFLYGIF